MDLKLGHVFTRARKTAPFSISVSIPTQTIRPVIKPPLDSNRAIANSYHALCIFHLRIPKHSFHTGLQQIPSHLHSRSSPQSLYLFPEKMKNNTDKAPFFRRLFIASVKNLSFVHKSVHFSSINLGSTSLDLCGIRL